MFPKGCDSWEIIWKVNWVTRVDTWTLDIFGNSANIVNVIKDIMNLTSVYELLNPIKSFAKAVKIYLNTEKIK